MQQSSFQNADRTEEVRGLMSQAETAQTYEEAYPLVAQAIVAQLLEAMKAWKIPKAEQAHVALKASGLDELLVETVLKGKLTYQSADKHLNRMRDDIASRRAAANDVKNGILAFDGAAQRLAVVSGKNGPLQYPLRGNHARDSLITFASSLHR